MLSNTVRALKPSSQNALGGLPLYVEDDCIVFLACLSKHIISTAHYSLRKRIVVVVTVT